MQGRKFRRGKRGTPETSPSAAVKAGGMNERHGYFSDPPWADKGNDPGRRITEARRMAITLSPATEARLREMADAGGIDIDVLAETLILDVLDWDETDARENEAGIRRGLEAISEGRVRSMSDTVEDLRRKYGYTPGAPRNDVNEAEHAA